MSVDLKLLRELLDYDPLTGIFTWKVDRYRVKAGDVAGSVSKALGYVVIGCLGANWLAHRLAWWFVHGEMPAAGIDHKNRDKADNKISNLRPASKVVNGHNSSSTWGKSGYRGVERTRGRRWLACLSVAGKRRRVGPFDSAAEAHEAYLGLKRALVPEAAYPESHL